MQSGDGPMAGPEVNWLLLVPGCDDSLPQQHAHDEILLISTYSFIQSQISPYIVANLNSDMYYPLCCTQCAV